MNGDGGFIEQYVELVSQITDAPPLFIRASAYWLTSLLFGVNVVCPIATPGTSRPNIWFMLSGPPGITRKSTVIDKLARKFFVLLFTRYLVSRLQIDEKEAKKLANMVFIEKATPEGLADHIQLTCGEKAEYPLDRYSLLTTEFGGVLKLCEKEYMSGFAEALSKLYYGEADIFYLSSKGGQRKQEQRIRWIPEDLYVCALVGIQKLRLYVSPKMVHQGLLRRFIVIYQDAKDKSTRMPPLDPSRRILYMQFEDMVEDYFDMMMNYNQFDPQTGIPLKVFVRLDKSVINKINEICSLYESEYEKNSENLWLLYKQSSWEHLLKLTILEAIARTPEPQFHLGDLEVKVIQQDFERAFDFLNKVHEKSRVEISSIEAQPIEVQLPLSSGELNYIYNIIESAGQEGISRSELLIKSGLLKDELKRLIITLMEQDRVIAYQFKPPTGGRSQIRFFSKKFEKHVVASGGQPIPPGTLEVIW